MSDKMRPWADLVPDFAAAFIVEHGELRRLDRRESPWAYPGQQSSDPRGFTTGERTSFIRDCLLPSPLLSGVGTGPLSEKDTLVVNVRRGDYYTPENRPKFGMDVESYVRLAVEGSIEQDGALRRVRLVSDDIAWCDPRLGWLSRYARVTHAEGGAAQNFLEVSSARRLVITNSTFSIWAAAVGNVVHGDNTSQVWSPAFFEDGCGPDRCYEYDSDWSSVAELPGGWQPGWMLAGTDSA